MVNRGEEKVRVNMNVVPRSTINTNGGTESTLIYTSELILCSYPYFLFAAIHHLNRPRLSLSDLVAQSEINGRSNPEVVGSIATEVKRIFSLLRAVP